MTTFLMLALFFAGGYVASSWTWPWLRTWLGGIEEEIASLKARAAALEQKIRGL